MLYQTAERLFERTDDRIRLPAQPGQRRARQPAFGDNGERAAFGLALALVFHRAPPAFSKTGLRCAGGSGKSNQILHWEVQVCDIAF